MTSSQKLQDVIRFYELMDRLEEKVGGNCFLEHADGKMNWPSLGVYFFFEPGEYRSTSGTGMRVVRVGTHALKLGAKTSLWNRLRQHRGTLSGKYEGGGNHRGSIFRLHVGTSLHSKYIWDKMIMDNWACGSSATAEIRMIEQPLEQAVSRHIRSMPFLWVDVNDPPSPNSKRGFIERNSIALLNNFPNVGTDHEKQDCFDPPSKSWLGRQAINDRVSQSGLWNANHVDEAYQSSFLNKFEILIEKM